MLVELLCLILIFAAISATAMNCFAKWQWLDLYEVYRRPWMMNRCDFCFGFWLSVLQALIYFMFTGNWIAFLAAFAAASITAKLLR